MSGCREAVAKSRKKEMSSNRSETPDNPDSLHHETLTAQAMGHVDGETRALVAAIYPSTTYERDADGEYSSGRGYTRPHNPTYDESEKLLSVLEGGSDCILFSSGMAAATAVFQSLLPGDHVIAPKVMYWALRKWLIESAMAWGLDVEFIDTSATDNVERAIRPGVTRLVWLETPSNPTWDIADIKAITAIAHGAGARVAVDSTVASPVITRPIEFGVDLVVHSATKYLNGHSDVLAGAVVCRVQDGLWNRIKAWRRDAGAVLGPFEAWLLLRGMRTLFIRVARSSASAMAIATHLETHVKLRQVLYPGLVSHPGHAVALTQMNNGFGGMLSIRLVGGEAAAMETAARVKVFKRATSLGGVESLIEHRASIEGPASPVPRDLLRLSVGLENIDDLITDLEQALDHNVTGPAIADAAPVSTTDQLDALVTEKIRPVVMERGGDIARARVIKNSYRIQLQGSPGAVLPLQNHITGLIRHYIDADAQVEIVCGEEMDSAQSQPSTLSLKDRVTHLITTQINPAIASHQGEILLEKISGQSVYISLSGGCQGCAMAEVTVRQGVELLIKRNIPEVISVVDVTDHTAGTSPFFKTKKGS